jgi:hypothetical protein
MAAFDQLIQARMQCKQQMLYQVLSFSYTLRIYANNAIYNTMVVVCGVTLETSVSLSYL